MADPAALRRARAAAQLLGPQEGRAEGAGPPGRAGAAEGAGATGRGGSAVGVVRRLLAVQAQDLDAARLALRARSAGLTRSDVDAALADGSLVVGWSLRGTLHLVAAEDHGWLLGLTAERALSSSAKRLRDLGLGAARLDRAVAEIVAALGDGPLPRPALGDRLADAGVELRGQALPHALRVAALRGRVVLGPVTGGGQAFVLTGSRPDDVPGQLWDRDAALARLAARYLAAHAPATAADLATWSGLALREARAGLAAVEVPEPASVAPVPPRLLPAFDPYLLGWRTREHAVAAEHARHVHPGGGVIRAVATDDGLAVATWTLRRTAAGAAVALQPFGRLRRGVRAALDDEAADVARFEAS